MLFTNWDLVPHSLALTVILCGVMIYWRIKFGHDPDGSTDDSILGRLLFSWLKAKRGQSSRTRG